jgi:hypothetical protein
VYYRITSHCTPGCPIYRKTSNQVGSHPEAYRFSHIHQQRSAPNLAQGPCQGTSITAATGKTDPSLHTHYFHPNQCLALADQYLSLGKSNSNRVPELLNAAAPLPGCTLLPCLSKNLPPLMICGNPLTTRPTAERGVRYSTEVVRPCNRGRGRWHGQRVV